MNQDENKNDHYIKEWLKRWLIFWFLLVVMGGCLAAFYQTWNDSKAPDKDPSFWHLLIHETSKNMIVGTLFSMGITFYINYVAKKGAKSTETLLAELKTDLQDIGQVMKGDGSGLPEPIRRQLGISDITLPKGPKGVGLKKQAEIIAAEKEEIMIIGVTLKVVFNPEDAENPDNPDISLVKDALFLKLQAGVKVEVLLIDPNCESAKKRSFREYRKAKRRATETWQEFNSNPALIQRQTNWDDLEESIACARELQAKYPNFKVKLYDSDAQMFMLITTTCALIEPLHYGKVDRKKNILSGKMPHIEFTSSHNNYHELADSFRFVWDHYAIDLPPMPSQGVNSAEQSLLSQ